MKTLFTDLDRAELARLGIDKGFDVIVGPEEVGPSRSCVGCFGCWTKTPGTCVLRDGLQRLGETLARTDVLQIVSRCAYGGYSRTVKAIIDRCIPYVHPCFRMLGGEMHHRLRYDRTIRLRVCLYGPSTAAERETLSVIAGANARNLGMRLEDVWFPAGPEGVLERESAPCASDAPRVRPSAAAASDGLVLVNASPKGERSATKILLSELSDALLEKGDTVTGTVSCPRPGMGAGDEVARAGRVVIGYPLYVDALPSNLVDWLDRAELEPGTLVYALSNLGFYESEQIAPSFSVLENFCAARGLVWGGGLMVGAGGMIVPTSDRPAGSLFRRHLAPGIGRLATAVVSREDAGCIACEPVIPRFAYRLMAERRWRSLCARSGADIDARPTAE